MENELLVTHGQLNQDRLHKSLLNIYPRELKQGVFLYSSVISPHYPLGDLRKSDLLLWQPIRRPDSQWLELRRNESADC